MKMFMKYFSPFWNKLIYGIKFENEVTILS